MTKNYYVNTKRMTKISLKIGDILECENVIVNPTDESMSGSGGLDWQIHQKAGSKLNAYCQGKKGYLPGDIIITPGLDLNCPHILHVVVPRWTGKEQDKVVLAKCYRNILMKALKNGIREICIPTIATGSKGFPIELAAQIAINTCMNFVKKYKGTFKEITWVLYSVEIFDVYVKAMEKLYTDEFLLEYLDPDLIRHNIDYFAMNHDNVVWKNLGESTNFSTVYPVYPDGMNIMIMDIDYEYDKTMDRIKREALAPSELNVRQIQSYLTSIVRGERFAIGYIYKHMKNRVLLKLFLRLDDLWQKKQNNHKKELARKKEIQYFLHEQAVLIWNDMISGTLASYRSLGKVLKDIVYFAKNYGIQISEVQLEDAFWRKMYLTREPNKTMNTDDTHIRGHVCFRNHSGFGFPNGIPVLWPPELCAFLPYLEEILTDIYEFDGEDIFLVDPLTDIKRFSVKLDEESNFYITEEINWSGNRLYSLDFKQTMDVKYQLSYDEMEKIVNDIKEKSGGRVQDIFTALATYIKLFPKNDNDVKLRVEMLLTRLSIISQKKVEIGDVIDFTET